MDGVIPSDAIWTFPYLFPPYQEGSEEGKRPWVDIESLIVHPTGESFWLVEKTVRNNGAGPMTVWGTQQGRGPLQIFRQARQYNKEKQEDGKKGEGKEEEGGEGWKGGEGGEGGGGEGLVEWTRRGRDAMDDPVLSALATEVALVRRVRNPDVSPFAATLLSAGPQAFHPPLEPWQAEAFGFNEREGGGEGRGRRGRDWGKMAAVTGADMHPTGEAVVVCTYGGIWEFPLSSPFNISSLGDISPTLLSLTSNVDDPYWQTEAVCYDPDGKGVWFASEYYKGNQPIRHFACADDA